MKTHSFIKEKVSCAALAAALCALPAFAQAETMPLASHRAIYDLRVVESPGSTGISSGDGRLVYEFKHDACEGYTSVYRQVMNVKAAEGASTTIDFRSTSVEGSNGEFLRFESKNLINGSEESAIQGEARRTADGIAVTQKAGGEPLTVGKNAVFPTQHMVELLDSARAGKNLFEKPIFDGSGKADSAGDTLTLIGKGVAQASEDLEQVARTAGLDKIKHWPITISYFDNTKPVTEQTPKFVFKADLYENGITRDMNLNYGTFVVQAKLVGLEMLPEQPQKTCGTPQ